MRHITPGVRFIAGKLVSGSAAFYNPRNTSWQPWYLLAVDPVYNRQAPAEPLSASGCLKKLISISEIPRSTE
jgi:hypothetical protein